MRLIAKIQFTGPSGDFTLADRVGSILSRWSDRKFVRSEDGSVTIKLSGVGAAMDRSSEMVGERRRDALTVLEPIDGGNLQTEVSVVAGGGRTAVRCILSAGSDGGLAPAEVELRAPRFVREIVGLDARWSIGLQGERVFAQSFDVESEDVPELERLMSASARRLPIVMVSELNGETLAGDLHERLSQDLCGIAHTVRISEKGSWELTRLHGREWSCYNGAVRLFWPFRAGDNDFRSHPLWTLDQLLSRADSEVRARDGLRRVIARRLLEASTFVADDPAFRDFDAAKVREAADRARAMAVDDGDMKALADLYARENDALRAQVDEKDKEIEALRSNVETLTIAFRTTGPAPEDASETPPQTVEEAVAASRREAGQTMVIARETDEDVAKLNPAAGPPDKILRYLRTLKQLADTLATGPLGQSVPIWLRQHGVDCSVESETSKANRDSKRFRTRLIDGESVECEFHAKPSDSVSPDMCVRIYFAVANATPFVKVGYVGRHIT